MEFISQLMSSENILISSENPASVRRHIEIRRRAVKGLQPKYEYFRGQTVIIFELIRC